MFRPDAIFSPPHSLNAWRNSSPSTSQLLHNASPPRPRAGSLGGEAVTRTRPVASSDSGRADQRNHLAFVPAINAKILVGCDHAVVRIKLAHPDQTKIRQIRLSIRVALG